MSIDPVQFDEGSERGIYFIEKENQDDLLQEKKAVKKERCNDKYRRSQS
ncbi:MAG TPA: hypothetical protein VIY29_17500 [Ktedonobacteraceae bacterium]